MNKKGLLVVLFFGGIMVTSGFGLQSMMTPPDLDNPDITITGTPADNFPDKDRAQFCGSSNAKSTDYVQEFSIPTLCTNPLAVVTDYDGNVWFTQTNTGKVAKFDPTTETFTEYDNPSWPPGGRSMMWGIDYAPDGYWAAYRDSQPVAVKMDLSFTELRPIYESDQAGTPDDSVGY